MIMNTPEVSSSPAIEFRNVSVSFDGEPALIGINLRLDHGAWSETPGQPSPHSAARKAGVKVSLTKRSRLDVSIASANPFQELKRAWCIQDANRGVCERSWHPQ